MTLTQVLGLIDVVGALVVLWAAFRITSRFGIKTDLERWALIRRGVYLGMAWALFSLGIKYLNSPVRMVDPPEFIYQASLLFGIIVFPLLRAFNLISQDTFLAFHGSGARGDRSEP